MLKGPILWVLFLFFPLLNLGAQEIGPKKKLFKIDEIRVRGIKKVEKEAIIEKIISKKGMVLDNYTLKKDLDKIYSLKYFEFVEAHQKRSKGKNILEFIVKEKPIVTSIEFDGNDELDLDELSSQISTKEFSILDINTVKNDVKKLEKFYEEKGFYLASISFNVRQVSPENVEVTFKIQEFDKVKVKKIIFLGNKSFEDDQLKSIMQTNEEGLFSFMSDSGNFKEFNFQTDIERLKYFYQTKGYLQINVGTPEITVSEDKKWVFITIKVNEGPRFSINNIFFQGEVLFPERELKEKIELREGNVYSEEHLRKDIQKLTEIYQDEGYAFANVLRQINIVPGENKVDIEFSFEKGKIAYFGKIFVKGNTKTRDKVVRRELKIREGARYSGSALRQSKENVNRLGFFERGSVVFNTITPKGKDDVLDVEITVKEKNTGQITLGAGYSTATKGFLNASISQNNFAGKGQTLSFKLTLSGDQQEYNIGFTEPYLFDSTWSAGGRIFSNRSTLNDDYEVKRKGFSLQAGHPIFNEFTRLFASYNFTDTALKDVNNPLIVSSVENGISSSVRTTIETDKRDNRFEPSSGYFTSFSTEYVGVGGDKKWIKTETDLRYFKSVWGDLVFRSRLVAAKIGKNGKEIPINQRFTLGGPRNLRGYGIYDIGPKVEVVNPSTGLLAQYDLGGLFQTYTQLEFEHPLAREAGLKWVVFFDAGNVYDRYIGEDGNWDLKMDYGFGFRWFSPIGVLRFEFGYPLDSKVDGSQFHFDIGQLF